jgi:fructose-1,6-bisphosphatase/inositol monophosphatase family enzyme
MTDRLDPSDLRSAAMEFVRAGAAVAADMFGKVASSRKADRTPVTEADHAVQDAILTRIAVAFPAHAVLVEETLARPERHAAIAAAAYCWVVDPIDGTRNYARGVRTYATCVAVMHGGRPVAGAVHDASTGVYYSASLGGGAFAELPGGGPAPDGSGGRRRLKLGEGQADRDSTVAVSSFRKSPMPPAVRGWLDRYLLRSQGAVALHLAHVAAGFVDGAFSTECKLWDVAAATLLIEEAGGVVTRGDGAPLWPMDAARYDGGDIPILAGTRAMYEALLVSLNSPNPII